MLAPTKFPTHHTPDTKRHPERAAVVLILTRDDVELTASALRLLTSCARSDAADAEHSAARGHHDEQYLAVCRDEAATLRAEADAAESLRDLCMSVLKGA